jgi:hypothetical protein
MRAADQYAVHILGLFLLASALTAEGPIHPAVWLGALMLIAIPVLSAREAAQPK